MAPLLGVPRHAPPRNGTQDEMLRPVPWFTKMDSRPNPASSMLTRIHSAMVSSASSQLMRSHLFSPRAPARLRGHLGRSA